MRALITGWFGTQDGEITAGDALAAQTVRGWLREAGVSHDVAMADDFRGDGELAPEHVDPAAYTHVLFVCGPTASDRVATTAHPLRALPAHRCGDVAARHAGALRRGPGPRR